MGGDIELKTRTLAILLILPAMIVIFGLKVYPLLETIRLSMYEARLGLPGTYVGFRNFAEILSSERFRTSLFLTSEFFIINVSLGLAIGLFFALVLNEELKGRSFFRTVLLIPWALVPIVNGLMWQWIYDGSYGVLNSVLYSLGLIDDYIVWLRYPTIALLLVIFADMWRSLAFITLFYLAALQVLPKQLLEAAEIDGAGSIRKFIHITLPFLRPTITILLVLRTMQTLKVFDIVYAITEGGPAGATEILNYYVYKETFLSLRQGKGAAMSVLLTLLILGISLLYMKFIYKEIEQ